MSRAGSTAATTSTSSTSTSSTAVVSRVRGLLAVGVVSGVVMAGGVVAGNTVPAAAAEPVVEPVAVLYRDGLVRPYLCTEADRRAWGLAPGGSCVVQSRPAGMEGWACGTALPAGTGPWPDRGRIVACPEVGR